METQVNAMTPIDLMERLSITAAEVFAVGEEEESDEVKAFKDVLRIIGKAREMPDKITDEKIADMTSLIAEIRDAEPEMCLDIIQKAKVQAREKAERRQIIRTLLDVCEWVVDTDEWQRVDKLIDYLSDYWEIRPTHENLA